jgi:hypothetical protein
MAGQAVLLGVGDVGPIHEPIGGYAELVRDTLKTPISALRRSAGLFERGHLQLHSGGRHSRCKPSIASVFSDCG